MSTPDPLDDFYLPGPAAKDTDADSETFSLRTDNDDFDDEVITEPVMEREQRAPRAQRADRAPGVMVADMDTEADTSAAGTAGGRGGLLAVLLLVMAVFAAGWYLAQPETLPIRQVNIEGEFRQLSRAELQQLVSRHLRGGFFSMDVTALRNAMTVSPWVRDVQVQRVWPDTLKLSVREQTAVAQWRDSGLVNSDGDYFEPDMATAPADLPQLDGPDGMQPLLTERLLQLQVALAPSGLEVRALTLSERRAWSFMTTGELEVVLGREDFERRLKRFAELVPASLGDRLEEATYIDMRYTNGFAVRFEDGTEEAPAKGPNTGNGAA